MFKKIPEWSKHPISGVVVAGAITLLGLWLNLEYSVTSKLTDARRLSYSRVISELTPALQSIYPDIPIMFGIDDFYSRGEVPKGLTKKLAQSLCQNQITRVVDQKVIIEIERAIGEAVLLAKKSLADDLSILLELLKRGALKDSVPSSEAQQKDQRQVQILYYEMLSLMRRELGTD